MKNNKSPGTHGLIIEFHETLCDSFKEALISSDDKLKKRRT